CNSEPARHSAWRTAEAVRGFHIKGYSYPVQIPIDRAGGACTIQGDGNFKRNESGAKCLNPENRGRPILQRPGATTARRCRASARSACGSCSGGTSATSSPPGKTVT